MDPGAWRANTIVTISDSRGCRLKSAFEMGRTALRCRSNRFPAIVRRGLVCPG
jgi:hypothetical protein